MQLISFTHHQDSLWRSFDISNLLAAATGAVSHSSASCLLCEMLQMFRTGATECFGNKLHKQDEHSTGKNKIKNPSSAEASGLDRRHLSYLLWKPRDAHGSDSPSNMPGNVARGSLWKQLASTTPSDMGLFKRAPQLLSADTQTLTPWRHCDSQPSVLDCPSPPSSRCHFAGDYILETKPKEISEAQRLNYEQVGNASSRLAAIIFTFNSVACGVFSSCFRKAGIWGWMYLLSLSDPLCLSPCGSTMLQVNQQLSWPPRKAWVLSSTPLLMYVSMVNPSRCAAVWNVLLKLVGFVSSEVAKWSSGCAMIWGGRSVLIAGHVILQLPRPSPPLHGSVGYIRCVLRAPENNRVKSVRLCCFTWPCL